MESGWCCTTGTHRLGSPLGVSVLSRAVSAEINYHRGGGRQENAGGGHGEPGGRSEHTASVGPELGHPPRLLGVGQSSRRGIGRSGVHRSRSGSGQMKGHLSGAQDFLCRESGGAVEAKHSGTPGLRQGCRDCDSSGTVWGLGPGVQQPRQSLCRKAACFVSKLLTLRP